jgi:hypothetical protein
MEGSGYGLFYIRSEVFTAVIMKKAVFWDVASCRYIPPKRQLTQYLHGATSQKTAFFMVYSVGFF